MRANALKNCTDEKIVVQLPDGEIVKATGFWRRHLTDGTPVVVIKCGKKQVDLEGMNDADG